MLQLVQTVSLGMEIDACGTERTKETLALGQFICTEFETEPASCLDPLPGSFAPSMHKVQVVDDKTGEQRRLILYFRRTHFTSVNDLRD